LQTSTMFIGEAGCLLAFAFLNSRFNPFKIHQRRRASRAARHAARSHDSPRLSTAPLSRPDEAAIGFNESSISLEDEGLGGEGYDSAAASGSTTPLRGGGGSKTGSVAAAAGAEGGHGMKWSDAVLFWLPATCDILGTTCMNVGLFFVPVSVYQMLRGALVLYVPSSLFSRLS
jgi:hypothetical protein